MQSFHGSNGMRRKLGRRVALGLLGVFAAGSIFDRNVSAAEPAAAKVDYARDVQPIFAARCYECHGPARQKGGLRLDGPAAILKGGESGAVVVAGKSGTHVIWGEGK